MDKDDMIEYSLVACLGIGLGALYVVLYLTVILACAWGVSLVMDLFGLDTDRTMYWTLVSVLILFCAFGRTKVSKDD